MPAIQLLGSGGSVDKLGIFSGKATWYVDREEEAIAFLAARPPHGGIPFSTGSYEQDEAGGFVITVQYEGFPPDGGPTKEELTEFSFDGTMGAENMMSHPKFESLRTSFEYDAAKDRFTGKINAVAGDGGLDISDEGDLRRADQIAGAESWLVVGGEYSITFSSRVVPVSIFRGVGCVVDRPRGIGAFNLELGKRNFLKLCPRVTKRGDAVQVTERYMMSNPVGFSSDIYGAGQLDPGFNG